MLWIRFGARTEQDRPWQGDGTGCCVGLVGRQTSLGEGGRVEGRADGREAGGIEQLKQKPQRLGLRAKGITTDCVMGSMNDDDLLISWLSLLCSSSLINGMGVLS